MWSNLRFVWCRFPSISLHPLVCVYDLCTCMLYVHTCIHVHVHVCVPILVELTECLSVAIPLFPGMASFPLPTRDMRISTSHTCDTHTLLILCHVVEMIAWSPRLINWYMSPVFLEEFEKWGSMRERERKGVILIMLNLKIEIYVFFIT